MPQAATQALTLFALALALALGLMVANVLWLLVLGSLFFPRSLDRWISSVSPRTWAKITISSAIYLVICVVVVTALALLFGAR